MAAEDAENLLVVIVTSWVFAAAALVFYGKFNLLLLVIAGGFVTGLVILSSALSLLSAVTLQKLISRPKRTAPRFWNDWSSSQTPRSEGGRASRRSVCGEPKSRFDIGLTRNTPSEWNVQQPRSGFHGRS
jgi:hypothetical protein